MNAVDELTREFRSKANKYQAADVEFWRKHHEQSQGAAAFDELLKGKIDRYELICTARDELMRVEVTRQQDFSIVFSIIDDELRRFITEARRVLEVLVPTYEDCDLENLARFKEALGLAEAHFAWVDTSIGPPPDIDVGELYE